MSISGLPAQIIPDLQRQLIEEQQMGVRKVYLQQFLYFFHAIKEGAAVDMKVLRGLCYISIMRQEGAECGDELCMVLSVIVLQLKDVVVDTGLQFFVAAFGEKVKRQRLRAEIDQLVRAV